MPWKSLLSLYNECVVHFHYTKLFQKIQHYFSLINVFFYESFSLLCTLSLFLYSAQPDSIEPYSITPSAFLYLISIQIYCSYYTKDIAKNFVFSKK